jgi:hypothetical protein
VLLQNFLPEGNWKKPLAFEEIFGNIFNMVLALQGVNRDDENQRRNSLDFKNSPA